MDRALVENLNIAARRTDFPILLPKAGERPFIYLDSAATSLKPRPVLEAIEAYYREYSANVKRGIYGIAEKATEQFERARESIARYIGADCSEVIFTSGTTEGLNVAALSWGTSNIKEGDEIIVTELEHHSNLIPWQELGKRTGAVLKVWPIENGELNPHWLNNNCTQKTKVLAVSAVSNVLGSISPIPEIAAIARGLGVLVVVDAAQLVPHQKIDVQELGADFVAFSGHKLLGPTGIGVLWGRRALLEAMPPLFFGGEMVESVGAARATYKGIPEKFEAGTPNIAGAIGLGAAVEYLERLPEGALIGHEKDLTAYAYEKLSELSGLTLYGPPADRRASVLAFSLEGVHPHDLAQILDESNIAIRAGHHCAEPLHKKLGVSATARLSFYLYNTKAEIDAAVEAIKEAQKMLNAVRE